MAIYYNGYKSLSRSIAKKEAQLMTRKTFTLLLALILVFSLTSVVLAQEEEVLPCTGDQVTGTLTVYRNL